MFIVLKWLLLFLKLWIRVFKWGKINEHGVEDLEKWGKIILKSPCNHELFIYNVYNQLSTWLSVRRHKVHVSKAKDFVGKKSWWPTVALEDYHTAT